MLILLGNPNPVTAAVGLADASDADVGRWRFGVDEIPEAVSVTLFQIPPSDGLITEVLPTVVRTWAQAHSDRPPVWVASDNDAAAIMLASHYNCVIEDVGVAMARYQALIAGAEEPRAASEESP